MSLARAAELLQKTAPILLRHFDAYVELAGQDWRAAKRDGLRKLCWLAVLTISICFTLLLGCGLIVAATWDSDYRTLAIGLMTCVFALIAVVAGTSLARASNETFATVRREWRADRELAVRLLSGAASERDDFQSERIRTREPFHERNA